MRQRPFEGIRVLDITWVATGPGSINHLAEFGAEVIQVQGYSNLDIARLVPTVGWDMDAADPNNAWLYANQSRSRYSLGLNLKKPKAVEIVKRLVARSDIVVESFMPGAIDRLGLGYEELKKLKPDIIMASASLMGQTGPDSSHVGYGLQLVAQLGLHHLTGWPDREPVSVPVPYSDYFLQYMLAIALISALEYRRRTGKGQYIDFSQAEAFLHQLAPTLLDAADNGRDAIRMGNRHSWAAPHAAFPCRGDDRWCAIAVTSDEEWQALCQVMGNPEWTSDPAFATFAARKQNEEELEVLVGQWTRNHSAEDVMHLMQAAGVPASVVCDARDLTYDPQLKHRGFYWEVEHPRMGSIRIDGHGYQLSKTPMQGFRPPLLGEHNEWVCKEVLGIADQEYVELVAEEVLEQYISEHDWDPYTGNAIRYPGMATPFQTGDV